MRQLFLLLLLSTTIASTMATGATQGTLFLVGMIPLHFDIRVSPVTGQLKTLDIENGETSLKVADVVESSNHINGYEIYIESVNAGQLLHNNGTSFAPYQVQYGVAGSVVTPPAVGSPLLVKTSGALTGLTFDFEEVFITIPATSGLPGGAYTDTIVFSMQAL
ncbi:MAG: hypothetical protein ACRBBP_03370 [Bdellovibrionales bacterium]